MSENDPVGKLFRTEDSTVVEWNIANFSTLPDEVSTIVYSPVFYFSGACFHLSVIPNGGINPTYEGYVGLYLYVQMSGECAYSVDAVLCLKDVYGLKQYPYNFPHKIPYNFPFDKGTGFGSSKICKRSDVMRQGSELLPADVLTVMVTLKSVYQCSCRVSLFQRLQTVSRNMKAILKEGKNSDVVLKLEGQDFKAHRAILGAGSKVFAAMFTHDMAENRTGEIAINDVEPDVFEKVLLYIYSGQVDNLSAGNVFKLYRAADKYDLNELKEWCKIFMEENISVDLFCDIVALADTYNEKELMKVAKEFCIENSNCILESVKRENFEHCVFAAQLLTSVMKENAVEEKESQ